MDWHKLSDGVWPTDGEKVIVWVRNLERDFESWDVARYLSEHFGIALRHDNVLLYNATGARVRAPGDDGVETAIVYWARVEAPEVNEEDLTIRCGYER
jgi:hypothetical protein